MASEQLGLFNRPARPRQSEAERKAKQKARNAKRNHAAIYAKRTEKAKAQQFTGYNQKRKHQTKVREMTDRIMNRIDMEGFDFSTLGEDDPEYWIWFRVNY